MVDSYDRRLDIEEYTDYSSPENDRENRTALNLEGEKMEQFLTWYDGATQADINAMLESMSSKHGYISDLRGMTVRDYERMVKFKKMNVADGIRNDWESADGCILSSGLMPDDVFRHKIKNEPADVEIYVSWYEENASFSYGPIDGRPSASIKITNEQYSDFIEHLQQGTLQAFNFLMALVPPMGPIKINTVNTNGRPSSATVSVRLAVSYVTLCTMIEPTEDNIKNEMQRIANHETFRGTRISNTAMLEDYLLTCIENKHTD